MATAFATVINEIMDSPASHGGRSTLTLSAMTKVMIAFIDGNTPSEEAQTNWLGENKSQDKFGLDTYPERKRETLG